MTFPIFKKTVASFLADYIEAHEEDISFAMIEYFQLDKNESYHLIKQHLNWHLNDENLIKLAASIWYAKENMKATFITLKSKYSHATI